MTASEALRTRGRRRGMKILAEFAGDVLHARLAAGISQEELGGRVGMSADKIGRIERAELPSLSFLDAAEVSAVLGLDLTARLYPNGARIRDAGQARRLKRFLAAVGPPLKWRTDVGLPPRTEGPPELRAWDSVLYGHGERTAVELEVRVTDMQQVARRHNAKRRDDPLEHFLLLVADTRHNRQVLNEYASLLADLPRLRTATVFRMLRRGEHPPTGWMFI